MPNVERVIIHFEPKERLHIRYAVPLENIEGKISLHFGEAPYFAILDFNMKNAEFIRKETLSNPASTIEKQKGIRSAEFLLNYKPDIIFSKKKLTGKSAEYVFESVGILMKTTDEEKINLLIKKIENELKFEKDNNSE